MVKPVSVPVHAPDLHIIAQNKLQNCTNTPGNSTLLLDILKTLEQRLQARGFLANYKSLNVQPLWFIAENSRNTFLWKNGLSIADCDKFEFWVDINKLADHRTKQLQLMKDGYCISTLPWGTELPDQYYINLELEYIAVFLEVTKKIKKHIHALSKAGLQLANELQPRLSPRQVIVLPNKQ